MSWIGSGGLYIQCSYCYVIHTLPHCCSMSWIGSGRVPMSGFCHSRLHGAAETGLAWEDGEEDDCVVFSVLS